MYIGTERRQFAACHRVMQRSIDALVEGLTQYRFDQTPFFQREAIPSSAESIPCRWERIRLGHRKYCA